MSENWVLVDLDKYHKEDKYGFLSDKKRSDVLDRFVDDSSAFIPGGDCFGKTIAHNTLDGCALKLKRRTMVLRSNDKGIIVVEGKDKHYGNKNQFVQKVELQKPKFYISVSKGDVEKLKTKVQMNKTLKNWDPKTRKTIPKGAPVTKKEFDKVKKCIDDYRADTKKIADLKSQMRIYENTEKNLTEYPYDFKSLKKDYKIPGFLKKTTLEGASNQEHIKDIGKFEEQRKKAKIEYDAIAGVYVHPEYSLDGIIKLKDGRVFSFDSQKPSHSNWGIPECGARKLHEKSMKTANKTYDDLEKTIKFKAFDPTTVKGVVKPESYGDIEMSFGKEFRTV